MRTHQPTKMNKKIENAVHIYMSYIYKSTALCAGAALRGAVNYYFWIYKKRIILHIYMIYMHINQLKKVNKKHENAVLIHI